MDNYALKAGLKYFCHTSDDCSGFIIEDISNKAVSQAQFRCNRKLYHATLKDCISHLNGTLRPIIFNGQDINPIRDCESVFLTYNPLTGDCYRPIDWEKYYRLIDNMTA